MAQIIILSVVSVDALSSVFMYSYKAFSRYLFPLTACSLEIAHCVYNCVYVFMCVCLCVPDCPVKTLVRACDLRGN